ncbi:hypothetical protein [Amycolatopsis sacchari]|nr:hypothetical protein [Amycolatopsis sacchari]
MARGWWRRCRTVVPGPFAVLLAVVATAVALRVKVAQTSDAGERA